MYFQSVSVTTDGDRSITGQEHGVIKYQQLYWKFKPRFSLHNSPVGVMCQDRFENYEFHSIVYQHGLYTKGNFRNC